jgi:hypothetical protein
MRSLWKRYSYGWLTLGLFVAALGGHWLLAWFAYADEQAAHAMPVAVGDFLIQVGRDTLENWQSEFLQLIWQVAGLAYFLYVGSPQSKEGDDRLEAKIDGLLRRVDPAHGEAFIRSIDEAYGGRDTDAEDAHR